ncbi:hypothetical protein REPUB_Repub02eG0244700 [Reevesia pubescens]
MVKAVSEGNNRKMDGRLVRVAEVAYRRGKGKRSSAPPSRSPQVQIGQAERRVVFKTAEQGRSFKDVLLGTNKATVENETLGDDTSFKSAGEFSDYAMPAQGTCVFEDLRSKVINFDLDIPHEEMEWLKNCAVGRIDGTLDLPDIQSTLSHSNVECSVRFLGGFSVIVLFKSNDEMDKNLKDYRELFEALFEDIVPWSPSAASRLFAFWITLTEVPLQVWNTKFFKALGDR